MINQTEQTLHRLNMLDKQQNRISYQMSTKKILQEGSDDATRYTRKLHVDDRIRTYEGIKKQLEKTTAQNDISDSTVKTIKDRLTFTKAELIKANNSTTTEAGLNAISLNIKSVKDEILNLANTKIEGEYIFAGSDATVKPFSQDSSGNIIYNGNRELRDIAVEDGVYKQRGINGFDLMYYTSSQATKGETLEFSQNDVIIDQDGNEWKLNSPANNTLEKYDKNGNLTTDTITGVSSLGTPPVFSATMPNTDGLRFEAKTNIFDDLNKAFNALKGVDDLGNPISASVARERIGEAGNKMDDAFDGVNIAHAELGAVNKYFKVSLDSVTHKITQYNVLKDEINSADLAQVAVEAKALELTYTALYSTINKTNELSLVNFVK